MKINIGIRWLIAGAFLLFILFFWSVSAGGCVLPAPDRINSSAGVTARIRCERFCEEADMELVEITASRVGSGESSRSRGPVVRGRREEIRVHPANVTCVCASDDDVVDPE